MGGNGKGRSVTREREQDIAREDEKLLQRAGYRTYHYGKFLNQYGIIGDPEEEVPPGWSDWASDAIDLSTRQFYGYTLNVNGQLQGPFGNPDSDAARRSLWAASATTRSTQ